MKILLKSFTKYSMELSLRAVGLNGYGNCSKSSLLRIEGSLSSSAGRRKDYQARKMSMKDCRLCLL